MLGQHLPVGLDVVVAAVHLGCTGNSYREAGQNRTHRRSYLVETGFPLQNMRLDRCILCFDDRSRHSVLWKTY